MLLAGVPEREYIALPAEYGGHNYHYGEIKMNSVLFKLVAIGLVLLVLNFAALGQAALSPVPAAPDAKQMLMNVLEAERQAIADYKARAEEAAAVGEKGLATHLEAIVEDETGHFEETEKILRGW